MMSVTAVGVNSSGVAKVNKQYVFATFTTTDSPVKLKNYTATVNFGDGTGGAAKIKFARGVFSVVATRKYPVGPETLLAQVSITDKLDNTTATAQADVQIAAAPNHSPYPQISPSLASDFDIAYGGTWTQSGNNYRSGGLTAVQIPFTKDITWSGNIASASVVVANSPYTQEFGFLPGGSGGSYTNLFTVNGTYANVTGEVGPTSMPATYRLADDVPSLGAAYTSNPANDPFSGIHVMAAFQINGLKGLAPHQKAYLICFDTPEPGVVSTTGALDYDYDNLIVRLTLQK
jgi:hypothetical protein